LPLTAPAGRFCYRWQLAGAGAVLGAVALAVLARGRARVPELSAPAVVSEVYLPGSAAGARRVGNSVRLVPADSVRWPEAMQWWPPYDPALYQPPDRRAAAIARLEDANEAVSRATPPWNGSPHRERNLRHIRTWGSRTHGKYCAILQRVRKNWDAWNCSPPRQARACFDD